MKWLTLLMIPVKFAAVIIVMTIGEIILSLAVAYAAQAMTKRKF
jgi:hypothetical protein